MTDNLLLAYYGDDYTGSTDALEALSRHGVRTALFLEPPGSDDLTGRFADLQAIGVAGESRSMTPVEMDVHLRETFKAIEDLDPTLFQYKVCSTFDSAPDRGSIGRAIDIGQDVFDSSFVPVVVGVPPMEPQGRYVVFGNLFATVDDETYRLDRHPTMRTHPATPMTESDLARHLGEQTDRSITGVTVIDVDHGVEGARRAVRKAQEDGEIVIFDTLTDDHLATLGRVIWERTTNGGGMTFGVGSSGFDYALGAYWQDVGLAFNRVGDAQVPEVDSLVVISGSASPVTAEQIEWALDHGYADIKLDTTALIDPDKADDEGANAIRRATEAIRKHRGTILYTARGPDDPAIEETRAEAKDLGIPPEAVARRIGRQQGRLLREFLERTDTSRVCIAGGDTSSYATPALDVYAVEMIAPIFPGAPLCRASARTGQFDGLEIALKGGQIGDEKYFERVRRCVPNSEQRRLK
ncbi:four-carbon acid sugar kinase family protein [Halegenticoccus soli]|uniref:four-carbon acid sugar kinase family protein n=1 Tax=Halegenticoccus soli TaxID=1985678 RepID=UPI0013046A61|nr:four-carbon acid sugar kinase family protein [Halegenticoccus soli]